MKEGAGVGVGLGGHRLRKWCLWYSHHHSVSRAHIPCAQPHTSASIPSITGPMKASPPPARPSLPAGARHYLAADSRVSPAVPAGHDRATHGPNAFRGNTADWAPQTCATQRVWGRTPHANLLSVPSGRLPDWGGARKRSARWVTPRLGTSCVWGNTLRPLARS